MKDSTLKKGQGMSIKWKIFFYLLLFATVIAAILWLCEVVFLNDIYKSIKINDIKSSAEKIAMAEDYDAMSDSVDEMARENNTCVRVFKIDDDDLILRQNYRQNTCNDLRSCFIHMLDYEEIQQMYDITLANGGEHLERFVFDLDANNRVSIEGELFDKDEMEKKLPEYVLYTLISDTKDGDSIFIMLHTEITPVEATVNTINKILVVVTVLLYLFALVLALVISHFVTKPIRKLTGSALELAKGNYSAEFDEKGYREISQLAYTLNYAEKELSRVDSLRRELIANISHDLRTPLTMIGGYSEVIRDIPGENTPENIQVIIDETKRLTSLVNDVLDISKLESGTQEMNIMPFNMTRGIENILQRFAKLCEKDGYSIEFFCDREVYVNADEIRISQVIYNLVGNALTHTGDSKNVMVRQIVKKSTVRIEVEDFGEGIEEQYLPDIWERYYKLDRVHKRSAAGSGLGLSIVRKIMEQSGGSYGVLSAVGKGSIFYIELPVYEDIALEDMND